MAYIDNSGLYVKTGLEQTVPLTGGEYRTYGAFREIELKIDLTKLTNTNTIINDQEFFPKSCCIESVQIFVDVAAATGAGVNVGFMRTDRSTVTDATAVMNGVLTAALTQGTEITLTKGSTGAGTQIGVLAGQPNVNYICAASTTGTAFTAGVIRIRIKYFRP